MDDMIPSIIIWIKSNSDVIAAAATVAIAAFTLTLWRATVSLWKSSQEQAKDMKTSISVAREAADAAKKSADALSAIERAYIFVKITIKSKTEKTNEIPEDIEIDITNHGRTPAILLDIRNIIFPDKPHAPYEQVASRIQSIPDSKSFIPSGTVIVRSGEGLSLPERIYIADQQRQEINNLKSTLFCIGRIKYQDIFGNLHETGYCWKYEQYTSFQPIENAKCSYWT